jgi:hypothetical protein
LIPQKDGSWRRGSFNGDEVAYPASTVKLTYLVSAVHWCEQQGKPFDCLEPHVRGMITISDNFEVIGRPFLALFGLVCLVFASLERSFEHCSAPLLVRPFLDRCDCGRHHGSS